MSPQPHVVTDAAIAQMLRARAVGPDPFLRDDILRAVGAARPARRLTFVAAAAAVVLILIAGAYLAVLRPQVGNPPTPTPATSSLFGVPFEYTPPAGTDLRPTTLTTSMMEFTQGGVGGDRGVTVAVPGLGGSHSIDCFGPVNGTSGPDPVNVLRGYEAWNRRPLPGYTPTTVDGHPALSVRYHAASCPTSHPTERTDAEPWPGSITVVDVYGTSVVVAVWAQTFAIYDEWLPTATQFVESIHFTR